jgi:hypothetical protein
LSKALNDRPIFHRRKFTATATVCHRVLVAEWPHEDEPDPPTPAEEEREWRAEAQRELLRKDAERRDGDEGRHQYV